jgi:hypothetical protein
MWFRLCEVSRGQVYVFPVSGVPRVRPLRGRRSHHHHRHTLFAGALHPVTRLFIYFAPTLHVTLFRVSHQKYFTSIILYFCTSGLSYELNLTPSLPFGVMLHVLFSVWCMRPLPCIPSHAHFTHCMCTTFHTTRGKSVLLVTMNKR